MSVPHRNNAVARARRLRAFACTLLVATALWTFLMVFSAFRWLGYVDDGWLADVGDGTLYVTSWSISADEVTLRGWHSAPNIDHQASTPGVWTWWQWGLTPWLSSGTITTVNYGYSIWPLSLPLAATGAAILITLHRDRRRRIRLKLCLNCGYSRKDLPTSTPCPECGSAEQAATAR